MLWHAPAEHRHQAPTQAALACRARHAPRTPLPCLPCRAAPTRRNRGSGWTRPPRCSAACAAWAPGAAAGGATGCAAPATRSAHSSCCLSLHRATCTRALQAGRQAEPRPRPARRALECEAPSCRRDSVVARSSVMARSKGSSRSLPPPPLPSMGLPPPCLLPTSSSGRASLDSLRIGTAGGAAPVGNILQRRTTCRAAPPMTRLSHYSH